ncbi:MAG: hypothetical protein N2748_04580, partial [candidate division WOR-3 bacterium]|nr:hypothetical protein [candidate division WOR-3 bacterium]
MTIKPVFIAWQLTTRTKTLAKHLNADIITYQRHFPNPICRLIHYLLLTLSTIYQLFQKRPSVVFVQVPPIQAIFCAICYAKLTKTKIIFDTHSIIFFPKKLHQKLYLRLYRYLIKHITLNIVHNQMILSYDYLKKTETIMLEDKIPFNLNPNFTTNPKKKIAVICSYHEDEPIAEILQAAASLPEYDFYFTGKSDKLQKLTHPVNIHFPGFLSDRDYEELLNTADLILVLTNRPDTVLCGAYEAVGVGKPLVTSNT